MHVLKGMLIWGYRVLFLPLLLIGLPYYLWRMVRRGGYARDFGHRFGFVPRQPDKLPGSKRIWLHAVSVGEILALDPLLKELSLDPNLEVILTTTTSTGYKLARQRYKRQVELVAIFPIDFYPCRRLAWKRWQPDIVILTEGEIWPELLHQARRDSVPVLLMNARLSDRSFRRYQSLEKLARPLLLDGLTRVLASSQQDGERFRQLLGDRTRVDYVGNIKCDVELKPVLNEMQRRLWLRELGFIGSTEVSGPQDRSAAWGAQGQLEKAPLPLVLLGSSTWPGEEAMLMRITKVALERGLNVRLLLVPRHAERASDVVQELREAGLTFHQRSKGHQAPEPVQAYLADTTGELRQLVQLADVVLIGKSMPPHTQGQTPIEAAGFGRPLIMGPEMSNFREIAHSMTSAGGARRAADEAELQAVVLELLENGDTRQELSIKARSWFGEQEGATRRTLDAIRELLGLQAPKATPGEQADPPNLTRL